MPILIALKRITDNSQFASVSGLRYRPPEVEVSEAISEAASRYEAADMGAEEFVSGEKIPDFQTLVQREAEAQLRSMDHIKFVRKVINKVRNKNVNYMSKGMEEKSIEVKPLSSDDVLLSVALYPCHSMSMIQEYLVLGSQKLTELKDVLYCLQDESVENNEVDTAPSALVSTKNTSGFFFFGDTFYNDTRLATNTDYATPIIEFIDQGRSPYWSLFAPFKATVMENTTFNDLTLQVGKKYLYCHRARCEHIIVVTAIRQILPSDDQNANSYPKQIYQSKHRQRKCTICDRTVAKWITTDDTFSIENPSYYCAECFDMAHRHHNGTLNNTGFKLLPYLHD